MCVCVCVCVCVLGRDKYYHKITKKMAAMFHLTASLRKEHSVFQHNFKFSFSSSSRGAAGDDPTHAAAQV